MVLEYPEQAETARMLFKRGFRHFCWQNDLNTVCLLSQSDQQLDCALDLMRRLPPQQIEKNLSDLIDLVCAVFPWFHLGLWLLVAFVCPSPCRTQNT